MLASKVMLAQCHARGAVLGLGACCRPCQLPPAPTKLLVRSGHLIPPSQYHMPYPIKFNLRHAMIVHWEIIPLIVTTAISVSLVILAVIWACKNKVDVVFSTHNCSNISRTMNLRKPTVHKIVIVHQRYEPWPEMQDVLDKLRVAEHRAMIKATKCTYEQREVDVVFETHSRENISRTMDLRYPSTHKIVIINQRYDPWLQMQKVLDEMAFAEKRAASRARPCIP